MERAACLRAFSFLITMSQVNLEKASVYSIFKLLINITFFIENGESHNCNKNAFSDFKTLHHIFIFLIRSKNQSMLSSA